MAKREFTEGLHDLGNGCWAYLQPDGGWGLSNAGLVSSGKHNLLIDTLFDLPRTRRMLEAMHKAVPSSARIETLVNTHSNPDHTFGNQLVEGAQIVASQACYDEMKAMNVEQMRAGLNNGAVMGPGLAFLAELMGPPKIDTTGVIMTLPTRTFDKTLTLHVGDKDVRLVNVGPAHTGGDVIVYVPGDKTVFTGDILFMEGHPIMWAGPASNWIAACDLILSWDVETVVPGHGAITDKTGVRAFRDYLVYIDAEARKRHAAGMPPDEAAEDISLDAYANWLDAERIMVNVRTIYRGLNGEAGEEPIPLLFGKMAEYHRRHAKQ